MSKDLIAKICTGVEIVGILVLTGIAFKRNNDCYKAECKLIKTECELIDSQIDCMVKDIENHCLKTELKELKKQIIKTGSKET